MEKINAKILKSTGSWYQALLNDGEIVEARLKGKLRLSGYKNTNPIAVGDVVILEKSSTNEFQIKGLEKRENYIIRKSNNLSKQTQVLASNIDLVVIIASLVRPLTSTGFIDRILVTAEAYQIPAIIFFNKIDLCEKPEDKFNVELYLSIYQNIGYKCFIGSVMKEEIPKDFIELIMGKTIFLTGHSGVGKSSFLNYIKPNLNIKTATISDYSNKGKHTTTFAEMHVINQDTFIIDSPGIKDFGIVNLEKAEIAHYFPEMKEIISKCKYSNCIHINEPNCAIIEAVENETIAYSRYKSYLSIMDNEDSHH